MILKSKKKPKTKGKLVKELDALYSRYIRNKYATDNMVMCVSCGRLDEVKSMQNGHYMSRQFYSTRWLDKNCHPQCYRCNVALKGNYPAYTKFMISTYGVEVLDELIELSKKTPQFKINDIQEMIEKYKCL